MSVVIRMKRAGAKKRPFYRVVVADSRYARDGRYIEQLGYYDPLTDPAKFHIDAGKFEQWIRRGARPSESVEVMMQKHAPGALRPAPIAPSSPVDPNAMPSVEGAAPEKPAKAAKKEKKASKPKAKVARKARGTKKGSEKKAKAKAKAKARKASGVAKPRKTKKAKKSKK
jgi:small subunit ribosomal protein S16